MKKIGVLIIISFLLIGFVLAQSSRDTDSGQQSEDSGQNEDESGNNPNLIAPNPNANGTQDQTKTQTQEKIQAKDGTYTAEGGEQFQIQSMNNNRIQLRTNNVGAESTLQIMQQTDEQGKTKLEAQLSNGKKAEIKVMPDTASERALERLKLKVCSSENNCTIELKEVGSGDQAKATYEVQIQRHSRILGIFQSKMQVKSQVNAENGEVEKVMKPWWAFIASEPAEE